MTKQDIYFDLSQLLVIPNRPSNQVFLWENAYVSKSFVSTVKDPVINDLSWKLTVRPSGTVEVEALMEDVSLCLESIAISIWVDQCQYQSVLIKGPTWSKSFSFGCNPSEPFSTTFRSDGCVISVNKITLKKDKAAIGKTTHAAPTNTKKHKQSSV
jgi:hypothetical protein